MRRHPLHTYVTHLYKLTGLFLFCLSFLCLHAAAAQTEAAVRPQPQLQTLDQTQPSTLAQSQTSAQAQSRLPAPVISAGISGEGYVLVTWDAVEGAQGYEVWRRAGASETLAASLTGEHRVCYFDRKARVGKSYSYRVRAKGSSESEDSDLSAPVTLRPRLAIPILRSVSRKKVSWRGVRGASAYQVYMKRSPKGKWTKIGRTRKTSFTIPKKYRFERAYYTVRAVKGSKQSGYDPGFSVDEKSRSRKKILFDGDSITHPDYSWERRTARSLGLKYVNRSRSRSRISDTLAATKVNIYRKSMTMGFRGFDVIVIAAGTNDWGNSVPLGDKTSRDPKCFYGAYHAILKKIKKDAPKASVILCLPLDRGRIGSRRWDIFSSSCENEQGCTLQAYRDAIRYLAKQYGCLVYDPSKIGMNSRDSIVRNTFDLLHPNYWMQVQISQDFKKFLKKKVMKKWEKDMPAKIESYRVR